MIWLQNNEQYNSIAQFEYTTRSWKLCNRNENEVYGSIVTDGFFSILSGVFIAIFRLNQELMLCMGDILIPLSEKISVEITGNLIDRRLKIYCSDTVLFDHCYILDATKEVEGDLTPFVDEEDFDFGLFLSNIAKSTQRQKRILELR